MHRPFEHASARRENKWRVAGLRLLPRQPHLRHLRLRHNLSSVVLNLCQNISPICRVMCRVNYLMPQRQIHPRRAIADPLRYANVSNVLVKHLGRLPPLLRFNARLLPMILILVEPTRSASELSKAVSSGKKLKFRQILVTPIIVRLHKSDSVLRRAAHSGLRIWEM